jgi:hypothetical protein
MKHKTILSLLLMAGCIISGGVTYVAADASANPDISSWDGTTKKKEKKPRLPDPYVKAIAAHFDQKIEDIHGLFLRGYGRNELIKMLIISQRSGATFKDLVKQRDKGKRLSQLAEKYKLDYYAVLDEATTVRAEIDKVAFAAAPVSTDALPAGTTAPAVIEKK